MIKVRIIDVENPAADVALEEFYNDIVKHEQVVIKETVVGTKMVIEYNA